MADIESRCVRETRRESHARYSRREMPPRRRRVVVGSSGAGTMGSMVAVASAAMMCHVACENGMSLLDVFDGERAHGG